MWEVLALTVLQVFVGLQELGERMAIMVRQDPRELPLQERQVQNQPLAPEEPQVRKVQLEPQVPSEHHQLSQVQLELQVQQELHQQSQGRPDLQGRRVLRQQSQGLVDLQGQRELRQRSQAPLETLGLQAGQAHEESLTQPF